MLRNYVKIALRNLWKNKVYSAINIVGMAVGLLATVLIAQYVRFELSYDRQSPQAEQIWRVYNETHSNGRVITKDANSHSIVGPLLQAQLPEVVDYARLVNSGSYEVTLVRQSKEPVLADRFFATDPGFLRLFPQTFLAGNASTCLTAPYQIALTQTVARQLFGAGPAVGQTVAIADEPWGGNYTVTGVIADSPANTHLKVGVLVSYQTRYAKGHRDNWDSYWDYTYLLLSPGAEPAKVGKRLAELSAAHLRKEGITLRIQPFTDIHLHSDLTYELEPNSQAQTVAILALTALLILVIAWLNSVNLNVARALKRASEVGMRKMLGGNGWQLFRQFLLEAFLHIGIAAGLVVAYLPSALRFFSLFIGRPLDSVSLGADWVLWAGVILVFWSLVGLSAWVQVLIFSRLRPIDMLQGRFMSLHSGKRLQKGLVVFQFAASTALLISLFVIHSQLQFLQTHSLGVQLDQLVSFKAPSVSHRDTAATVRLRALQHKLAQLPGVASLCQSSAVPSLGINQISGTSSGITAVGKAQSSGSATVYFLETDTRFFNTFSIPFLAGGVFRHPNQQEQYRHVTINQSAARLLGFTDAVTAVGKQFFFNHNPENRYTIHGVVPDFHIESLRNPTRPTIYYCLDRISPAYITLKVGAQGLPQTLSAVEAQWRKQFPESVFRYAFLDQQFDAQYRAEQQFSAVYMLFAGLATLIACLGLFGLAAFTAEQRTKEIGVRKVLGASVASIVALLSRDFLKLVLLAIIIAAPVAWWAADRWLQGFAYKINIEWWMFAAAGLLAVGIALFTVSFQSVRAALTNPVKSLRTE